jgi:hypothetical protein
MRARVGRRGSEHYDRGTRKGQCAGKERKPSSLLRRWGETGWELGWHRCSRGCALGMGGQDGSHMELADAAGGA